MTSRGRGGQLLPVAPVGGFSCGVLPTLASPGLAPRAPCRGVSPLRLGNSPGGGVWTLRRALPGRGACGGRGCWPRSEECGPAECVPAGRRPSPACPLEDRGKGGLCQVGPLSSTICRIWCYAKTPRGVYSLGAFVPVWGLLLLPAESLRSPGEARTQACDL